MTHRGEKREGNTAGFPEYAKGQVTELCCPTLISTPLLQEAIVQDILVTR